MNTIYTNQSTKDNMDYIYAQARIYDNIKSYSFMNFLMSIVVPVILTGVAAYLKKKEILPQEEISAYLGLYGLIVLTINILLTGYISSERKKAATIQEMYDTNVLKIKWNALKVGKEISRDEVFSAASFYRENPKKAKKRFKDEGWYVNKIYEAPQNIMALLCHGKNFGWDKSLRQRLNQVYVIGIITSVFCLAFYGVFMKASFNDILFYIVFTLPLIRYFLVQFLDNRKSIQRTEKIKDFIDKKISDIKISGIFNDDELNYTLRSIQDEIFTHRSTCPSVPNKIQLLMKKKNEMVYDDYFEQQIEMMKRSKIF